MLKKVKPSSEGKIIKLLTFFITCFRHCDIFAKPLGRMTTATTFPAKMTLVHARALHSIENLVLVVVFLLEPKDLLYRKSGKQPNVKGLFT